jgi:hypothetical protein
MSVIYLKLNGMGILSEEETGWKVLKYTTLSMEIPIMAFIGYMIGKQMGQEVIGTFVGILLGTFVMWFHVLNAFKKIEKKK